MSCLVALLGLHSSRPMPCTAYHRWDSNARRATGSAATGGGRRGGDGAGRSRHMKCTCRMRPALSRHELVLSLWLDTLHAHAGPCTSHHHWHHASNRPGRGALCQRVGSSARAACGQDVLALFRHCATGQGVHKLALHTCHRLPQRCRPTRLLRCPGTGGSITMSGCGAQAQGPSCSCSFLRPRSRQQQHKFAAGRGWSRRQ